LPLTQKDREQLESEHLDPRRINICCALHQYYGPYARDNNFNGARVVPIRFREHPALGCAQCIKVYYIYDVLSVPPSQRAQRLEELEEVLHKLIEKEEQGTFDFTAYRHPVIEYDEI
jgi:hypothetical protein